MLKQHRPWAQGYRAHHVPYPQTGVVEGWISASEVPSRVAPPVVARAQHVYVKIVPHFEALSACVCMRYNGQSLPTCPLYQGLCLFSASIVTEQDTSFATKGVTLYTQYFECQREDINICVVEDELGFRVNGASKPLTWPTGAAVCGSDIVPVNTLPVPRQSGHKMYDVHLRTSTVPSHSFSNHMAGGSVRFTYEEQEWVVAGWEAIRTPLIYKMHIRPYYRDSAE